MEGKRKGGSKEGKKIVGKREAVTAKGWKKKWSRE